MGKGMHGAESRVREGHAGEEARHGHAIAGFLVFAVRDRSLKVVPAQAHCLEGLDRADRRGGPRDMGFKGVRKRVHPGRGRQFGGHGDGDVGIDQGHVGYGLFGNDRDFRSSVRVVDDGEL